MIDPLSVAASIIAIIQISQELVDNIRSVTNASKDKKKLVYRSLEAHGVLTQLQSQVEKAREDEEWFRTVSLLDAPNGPLEQYRQALNEISTLPNTKTLPEKLASAITWKFTKENVERALAAIERFKSTASLAITNDIFKLAQILKEDLTYLTNKIDTLTAATNDIKYNQEKQALEDWLSPDDPASVHADKALKRQFNTGSWFLKATTKWRCGDRRRLWCLGMPGAGKTILASQMIDSMGEILLTKKQRLCHFYFNYKDSSLQTVEYVYYSLFKQLLQQSRTISGHIKSIREFYDNVRKRPGRERLRGILLDELSSCAETWIVIDALDECREDGGDRDHLIETLRRTPKSVKFLITSRDTPVIRDTINCSNPAERNTDPDERRPLTISANEEDVRCYVEGRLGGSAGFRRMVQRAPTLQQEVIDKVSTSVKGMFLMAVLHMESLAKKTNVAAVRRALDSLPAGLEGAYDDALKRIQDGRQWDLARLAIIWTVQAQRPLHLAELNQALTIKSGSRFIDEDEVEDGVMFVSECEGLVIIEQGSKLVRLVHETAQEYFSRPRSKPVLPGAPQLVAEACLAYLQLDAIAEGSCASAADVAIRIERLPFLRYSARFWGYHVASVLDDEKSKDRALTLLGDSNRLCSIVQVLSLPDQPDLGTLNLTDFHRPQYEQSLDHIYLDAPPLCVAAYFGLTTIAKGLVAIDADATRKCCSQGRQPLHYAAGNGQIDMIDFLVTQSIDVNAGDQHGVTALHLAADGTSADVVEALLKAGASTEARTRSVNTFSDWSYSHPLHWAASTGRDDNVKVLLTGGADIDIGNAWHRTPLHLATRQSRLGVMEILIAQGADVEAQRDGRGTPLCWAVENGHLEAAKLLLEHDAKLCVSSYQGTPLELAITYNQPAVEEYVLSLDRSRGGSQEIIRHTMRSAMSRTAHTDRAQHAFEKLLETIPQSDREIILAEEFAASMRVANFDSASYLIRLGANVRQEDQYGRTVMHMSLHQNRYDFFEMGARLGMDDQVPDALGCKPIHHAASGNCIEGLEKLLNKSADPDCLDNNGWTPLHWAALQGHHTVVDMLIAAGCKIDAVDLQDRKPLEIASATRPADITLLKKLGASDDEVLAMTLSNQYNFAENSWCFLSAQRLRNMRMMLGAAQEDPLDLQWDWDWARRLELFCDYENGQCSSGRMAQLLSTSNEIIYRAGFERVVQAARAVCWPSNDELVRVSLIPILKRPAFCECCCYLTMKHRYKCKCGKVNLCLRCNVDSESLFPDHEFVEYEGDLMQLNGVWPL